MHSLDIPSNGALLTKRQQISAKGGKMLFLARFLPDRRQPPDNSVV